MKWIVKTQKEASRSGNIVQWWKKTDPLTEIFCVSNFNKYSRYISLINVREGRRPVRIIARVDTARHMVERRGCNRHRNIMSEFSRWT
ncbi:hypothetical protein H5410_003460 [Solanum commersonii]|uniref:Uncharacterized protein n=1 Tax=Solanum commersonii TaxID=4109 RepID=A0A9J6B5Q9_SOLCO|nr:hypothetical protein H5410_003460 [Solanum commersonii]